MYARLEKCVFLSSEDFLFRGLILKNILMKSHESWLLNGKIKNHSIGKIMN